MQPIIRPSPLMVRLVMVAAMLMVASVAAAIVPPEGGPELKRAPGLVHAPEFNVRPSLTRFEMGNAEVRGKPGVQHFFGRHSEQWEVFWDDRGNRPHLIQGRGVPMVPGRGNRLTHEDLPLGPRTPIDLDHVEQIVRNFVDDNPDLFQVASEDLVLRPQASGNFGDRKHLWFLDFQQTYKGIPVAGSSVFFRITQGNLVQFGSSLVGAVHLGTHANLDQEEALANALAQLDLDTSALSERVDSGTLKIYPLLPGGESPGHRYQGNPGRGYRYVLVWDVVFRVRDQEATYKALVDAKTGQVLRLVDENLYARVQGGVYPETYTDPEVTYGFPFATVHTGGGDVVTDADGYYTYPGGTVTCNLDGRYTRINDYCGPISLSDSTTGNLEFGTSGGTDCTTPGFGGAGNTHAARTGFYHLSSINRLAASYHPTNSWLDGTLVANMNIMSTCNAYWNGSTVNFFRSGGGCGNTGEITAVFIHEWGHGFDQNTGNTADRGSGEAVGDTFAMLYTRNSCVGPEFRPGVNCHNCTDCTGVRDPGEFGLWGAATIASPANVASDTGIDCDRYTCPYYGYSGVMGYQGHCESHIASSALWDLGVMLRNAMGIEDGWSTLERLWYDSMPLTQSAYQIVSGGQCNPAATVDGCAATNYYQVFLTLDDDNGNLADGTPHGCLIWDAFNAHGIACGTRPACSDCMTTTQVYAENFDDGIANGFTQSSETYNLWHAYSCGDCYTPYDGIAMYLFSQHAGATCNYNVGFYPAEGTATSPVVNMAGYGCARLELQHYWQTESYPGAYDVMRIEVSADGGTTWTTVGYWDARDANPAGYELFQSSNVSTPSGTFQFRFTFDTVDWFANDYLGWFIDAITVQAGN